MSTDLLHGKAGISPLKLYALDVPCPLRDVTVSAKSEHGRRTFACEFIRAQPDAKIVVAAWHAVLHWLRYSDEPVLTGVLGARSDRVNLIITEVSALTTLQQLVADVLCQWLDDEDCVEVDNPGCAGLNDQLRMHAVYLHGVPADDANCAEFALICDGGQWRIDCATEHYSETYQRTLAMAWAHVLELIDTESQITISDMMATGVPPALLARSVNGRPATIEGNLNRCFASHVAANPEHLAVIDTAQQLSFAELDALSSRWAAVLQAAGIKRGVCVGVSFTRSYRMIAAQIAVLKAGAAFVPMDATQPAARLQAMVDDTSLQIILTEQACGTPLRESLPSVRTIEIEAIGQEDAAPAIFEPVEVDVDALAYVIFTSGSTGRPKGVMVSHGNLMNFVIQLGEWMGPNPVVSQFAPFTFDASVGEIYISLLNGGSTVLLPTELIDDPDRLQAYMTGHGVTFSAFPPQYAKHLSPEKLPRLKTLMTAGSAPDHEIIRRWLPHVKYINAYGPTETTILSTGWHAERVPELHEAIAIGGPIVNTAVCVINRFGKALPQCVVGELLIGGAGVTHGYLKREDLTRELYREMDGMRWYRSGDLCCLDARDDLVFAGRIDSQIKLRGHRLEPGEVEAALTAIDGVNQAATIVVDVQGSKQLVAFCVGIVQLESSLRQELDRLLPAWAIPNRIHWLDSLPLTVNGKTDYRRLQAIVAEHATRDDTDVLVAHEDALEAEVAAIWSSVLQQPKITGNDNFIHLGGDSLTALVVMSSLKRLGYHTTSSQLLARPRLSDFVAILRGAGQQSYRDYAVCSGEAPLSPIQGWFFRLDLDHPGTFCQTLMFDSDERLDVARLQDAIVALVGYHDELRASFERRSSAITGVSTWVQMIAVPGLPLPEVRTYDVDESQWSTEAERLRLELSNELTLSDAPLFRIALLQSQSRSRVVWVLHHIIVDTISHGILLDDLQQLYRQPGIGVEAVLPGKSISYMAWSRKLREEVMADLDARLLRWQPTLRELAAIPALPLRASRSASLSVAECRLPAQETASLLETATGCYGQSAEELVLAASYLAIARTLGVSELAIDIEWHGRDEAFAGTLGIDRTVGWFTSVHPHPMRMPRDGELSQWLMTLKESRAAVPQRGRDFYALRYLADTPEARAAFADYCQPDVLFNFSGIVQRGQVGWRTVPGMAIEMGEGNASPYVLSVESEIRDGELIISLYHDSEAWAGAVERLQQALLSGLREVIAHCSVPANRRFTPSDFPLAGLSQAQVDTLPASLRAVYPLTDMQQTMIRHKDTYQVFMAYRFPATYDDAAWRRTVADWVDRHDCLRTYVQEWADGSASQVVLETLSAPLTLHNVEAGEAETAARSYIERVRGGEVHIDRAPLFDLQVFDPQGDHFVLVLAIHHLIHDGWSIDLLINDLLAGYRHARGETARKPSAPLAVMADIVAMQQQLRDDVKWQTYWSALPWNATACQLPDPRLQKSSGSTAQQDTRLHIGALDAALANAVRDASRTLGVTVNSLWLAGYACLLRYLGGQPHVRCGVIQNGRMEDIVGVETITGCCVNTLPLVMDIAATTTGADIISEVNRQLDRMRASAGYPLSAIHAAVKSRIEGELFDTLFNIESHRYAVHDGQARAELVGGYESTNYGFIFSLIERAAGSSDAAATPPDYEVRIGYDTTRYDLETVQDWLQIYARCMQVLAEQADARWNTLRLLPDAMLQRATGAWNDTNRDFPHQRCVEDLFREQAKRNPQRPALLYKAESISYASLDMQTDRMARVLQDRGIGPETVVGMVADRSPDMVVAMLAIYKAGGAFVPIDPRYPADRVRHMVADSAAKIVLVQKRDLAAVIPDDILLERLYLDDLIADALRAGADIAEAHKPLPVDRNSRQLAYVMYTSGSTGQPKGVMIEQRSIVRLIKNSADFSFDPEDRILITSAPGFDVTTFEVWSALLNGLSLAVIDEEMLLDPQQLASELREKRVSLLWLIAPLFNQLIQEAPEMFASVKQLMIGGDALSATHVQIARQANPQLQVINGYGPTENTSFSTYHFVGDADRDVVPIGRPITNSTAYVFNADGQLLPPGVNGELYVGGPGVARGYLNQPELTAAKFVADPFSDDPDSRLYRTGDLVRWRRDGLIDFLGRIDHQVKIRGFRVELGEIENEISTHENIKQVLVLVKQDNGQKQLVAYCVPKQGDANDASFRSDLIGSVTTLLRETLPEYMVPAAFVMLDAMPRNANGKIDRARLPEPDMSAYVHSAHVPPQGETEQTLWNVWKQVLGTESFGVTDSFFSIGGDSIMAIQVVSGAAKHGLSLTPRLVIEQRTIRDILAKVGATTKAGVQKPSAPGQDVPVAVTGAQRLLPIHTQYLQDRTDADRYAQFARIELPADTTRSMLEAALHVIVARHDALRLKFRQTSAGWIAQYRPETLQADDTVLTETLVGVEGEALLDVRAEAAEALAGLDIKQGKLQRWIWRRSAQGQSLLWVIHHLAVDGVSWRILIEDLQAVLAAARAGTPVQLGPKTGSYQDWAVRVHDFAFGPHAEQERDYWLQQLATPVVQLAFDADEMDGGLQPEATTQVVEIALGSEDTQALAQRARAGMSLQVLLIAALTRALGKRLDGDAVRIDLEGHGRDLNDDMPELDLSQTVGWFTSLYPVRFDQVRQDLPMHLRRTRQTLSAVPNGGIGYGALQHVAHDEALEEASADASGRGILFNYLGQFSSDMEGGSAISPRRLRGHALRIDGMLRAGALEFRFDYSDQQLTQTAVTEIAEGFVEVLRTIVSLDPDDGTFAPDDTGAVVDAADDGTPFSLSGLSADRLGVLQADHPSLCDVYPCTLMQQGLLMFSDGGAQKDLYLSQMQFIFGRVDADRLRRSWQTLVDRHEILRTAFVDAGQEQLMQLVVADAPVDWREVDLRADGDGALAQAALARLKREEMALGFDLTQAPLMRLLLVRMGDDSDCLVWTHHHALIDGWSAAVLIRQLFHVYAAGGLDTTLPAESPYRRYVAWQSKRDAAAAETYWRDYFRGLDVSVSAQAPLERIDEAQRHRQVRYEQLSHELELSADVTARLTRLAQTEGVSLSTLMLVAWGLLLGKYIAEDEVLFGYTTSGRSAPVDGVESMVGLFINSLPVRVRADGGQTIAALLRQVQSQLLDNEDHGLLSLPEIQRLSSAKPGQALFDTLVVVENYPRDLSQFASDAEDSLKVRNITGESQTSFGLNLIVYPGERLMLELAYQRLQFDDAATSTLLRRLSHLLSSMAQGAQQTIGQLSILSAQEQTRATHDWNATALEYPRDSTLPEVFETVAQARQDAVALVFGEERWSYRELASRARMIARWLRAHGVRNGDNIALSMDKGPRLIASMLGIMEAGAAYVPVAVDCPADRRAFIVTDARIVWTLTSRVHRDQVSAGAGACLEIEDCFETMAQADHAGQDDTDVDTRAARAERTAYVIYTSGTTGMPKGVAIPHRSLINFCTWCIEARLFTAGSRMTQFAPYTFDASAGEIFGGLLSGTELHLLADALIMDPKALTAYLNAHAIEFGAFPPPYLQQIDPAQIPDGMTLLTAGSAPSSELVKQWGARCRYINGYGPTETTILSTAWICGRGQVDAGALSIGRPICNTAVYVVDRVGQLCAPDLLGEIWIGGDGVANEYLNRPELNQEHFLADPWKPGSRVYRTGDMGRWRADGQIEFVGRRDRQVKLRGFRIELDEIENRLRAHPQVQDAAVSVRGADSDKRLLAWVTRHEEAADGTRDVEVFLDELRTFLATTLPSYMLPQAITVMAQMPLTGNGKIDEKSLPEPELTASVQATYVAPSTDTERVLVEVWAAALKLPPEQISANANFFELGGHSLLAMRTTAQLRERLGVEVGVADLLAQPVLSDLARVADNAAQHTLPPIVAVPRTATMPLSFAQQRLWFLAQMEDVSQSYHIPGALRLKGELDLAALKRALDEIVARHEVLRATFVMDGEIPVQRFAPAQTGFALSERDLSAEVDADSSLQAEMREEFNAQFDLAVGPLLRGRLIRMDDNDHVLLITLHHIVVDGWSLGMVVNELGQLYRSAREGSANPLPALEVQYADYAVWQRSLSDAEIWKTQQAYWHEMLHDAPAMLELPTDRPRPPQQSSHGDRLPITLDATLTDGLRRLSQRMGVTLFTTVLAGWAIVLHRLSAQQDVVIGIPAANRLQAELTPLVGFFVNTLALRVGVKSGTTVELLLQQVKQRLVGAQANQQFPFEQVVEVVNPPRSLAHTPIFQVMLSWAEAEWSNIDLQDLSITMENPPNDSAKFDLTMDLVEDADGIKGELEYATALFDRDTVERHIGYFRQVLEAMVSSDAALVHEIELLDQQERQLLDGYNDTYRPELIDRTWPELFVEQAARTPDVIAVECETKQLTYRELETQSAQLAASLKREGVSADTIVALLDHRGSDLLVMIVAVLRAGGAYLALDPSNPPQRWLDIIEAAAPVVVLAGDAFASEQQWLAEQWQMDGASASGKVHNATALRAAASADANTNKALPIPSLNDLAYVIFTSGSTGKPKGVMIEHRGMINNMRSKFEPLSLSANDVIAQTASQSFDISVWQFLTAPLLGGRVSIVSNASTRDPDALLARLAHSGVTIWEPVPSVMQAILPFNAKLPAMRWVLPTGEALPRDLVTRWFAQYPGIPLMNAYGPAECSDDVSLQPMHGPVERVSIGMPVANAHLHVVDAHLMRVPMGVVGELAISGPVVGRGYLGRPDETEAAFRQNPYAKHASDHRLYLTGDLVRRLRDGSLEYIGRKDFQVKIRGFRIELGEIEACLATHPSVTEAVVLAWDSGHGDTQLAAYVTQTDAVTASQLQAHIRATLPDYMAPPFIVTMDSMPLTPNGKIDRKAMPKPVFQDLDNVAYEAPVTDAEIVLAGIWQDLLGKEQVGRNDHFFRLGGHSILAIALIARLREAGYKTDIATIMVASSLAALAESMSDPSRVDRPELVVPDNLIGEDITVITPQMLPLAQLTQDDIDRIVPNIPGGVGNIQDIYRLGPLQEGILFHFMLGGEGDTYLLRSTLVFDSRERIEMFLDALQSVINRHDILRTSIHWDGLSQPVQVVQRKVLLKAEEFFFTGGSALEQLLAKTDPDVLRIDLTVAPLLKVSIARDDTTDEWYLVLLSHHIACDNISLDLLIEEIRAHFSANTVLLPESVPYRNFIARAIAIPESDHEVYFQSQFSDVTEPTLPFGFANIQLSSEELVLAVETIDGADNETIRKAARQQGLTPSVLFHAAWALMIGRCSGRQDVVFGTVLSGRQQSFDGMENAIGMFINTLPLRIPFAAATVREAIDDTRARMAELLMHEQASLAQAQRCSSVSPTLPLFSSMLNYNLSGATGTTANVESIEGVRVITGDWNDERTNYPLTLDLDDTGESFVLNLQSLSAVDPRLVAEYIRTAVLGIADALQNDPQRPMHSIEVLPASERQRLLVDFNDTYQPALIEQTWLELFATQAAATPARVAVECDSQRLTYRELDERSTRCALALRTHGAEAGKLVALLDRRGSDLLVMIIATLKAGAAYLPLDPTHPPQRWLEILDDAGPQLLWVGDAYATEQRWLNSEWKDGRILNTADLYTAMPEAEVATAPTLVPPTLDDLSYVLFTSGSTGKPKGVMIEHRGMINNMRAKFEPLSLSADDVIAQTASQCFDISVWQFLTAMLLGAKVVIFSDETTRDPDAMLARLSDTGVTIWEPVPSVMQVILPFRKPLPKLRWVMPTGEALSRELVVRWFEQYPQVPLMNAYGPAECSDDVSFQPIHGPVDRVLIGKPVANAHLHLVDDKLMLAPVGVVGEIAVSGPVVGRGYHNRPDETRAAFRENPYPQHAADGRMYLTGDLGRRHADGSIEFVGRKDFQVKIRGFRIELGEIENCLELHPVVREAVVIAHAFGANGDKQLVAYVTTDAAVEVDVLRSHVRASLPDYMMPSVIMVLDALPLTGNGKVDRKQLPEPKFEAQSDSAGSLPLTDDEWIVAGIWQELLGVERVGRHDDFFGAGGNSISAIRLLNKLREQYSVELLITDIYRMSTVEAMAEYFAANKLKITECLQKAGFDFKLIEGTGNPSVLLLAKSDEHRIDELKRILSITANDLEFIRFSNEIEKDAKAIEAGGTASIAGIGQVSENGVVSAAERMLSDYHAALMDLGTVEDFAFSAIQKNFFMWGREGRKDFVMVPVRGLYSEEQLSEAFSVLCSEEDLLRAVPDFKNLRWNLIDSDAISGISVPVLDLKGLSQNEWLKIFDLLAPVLERKIDESPLAFSAIWASVSDMRHYLLFPVDHVIHDGMSISAMQRRMTDYLRGVHKPPTRNYRQFIADTVNGCSQEISDLVADKYGDSTLSTLMAQTADKLAERAGLDLQMIEIRVPLLAEIGASEQAFEYFKTVAHKIIGINDFGMVLVHHGRVVGGNSYFDGVGLFLDKVPLQVGVDTRLQDLTEKSNFLHDQGISYVAMEYAEGIVRSATLPRIENEVLFNFHSELDFEEVGRVMNSAERMHSRLKGYQGLMFEAHQEGDKIAVFCAFRGREEDVEALVKNIPGSHLVSDGKNESSKDEQDYVLVVNEVRKKYGDFEAVKGLSFRVRRGTCFGILGPNGAGKTSLLAMIEGLISITDGSISLLGMDVATEMQKIQPHLGVQLQQNNYFQFLTVAQLLNFYQELRSAVGGKRGGPAAEWLLERLELKDKLGFKVEELSGGQKQRLSIAIALLEDPDIIFLDEPTSALDPQSRIYTWEFIEQLKQDGRKTIILTTHYMEEAERLCDEIMIMNAGKVIAQGEPSALVKSLAANNKLNIQFTKDSFKTEHVERVASMPSVMNYSWDERSDTLSIQTLDAAIVIGEVLAVSREHDIAIINLDIERPSLEDVFLSHTGKELRE